MSDDWADSVVEQMVAATREEFEAIGPEIVASIQSDISVPVAWPGPVRSKPGEPPRLESGKLSASIGWEVTADAESARIELLVFSTVVYAPILEGRLGRPYFSTAFERWGPVVTDAAAGAATTQPS